MTLRYAVLLLLLALSACAERRAADEALPTQVDLVAQATAKFLTQESPPAAFQKLAIAAIDQGLELRPGWRYEMQFSFSGVFSRTTRLARADTRAEVSQNLLTSARRVVATIDNDLQSETDPVTYEAVLLGEDAFLVRDGICLQGAEQDARAAAALGAGSLLGGIAQANSLPRRATINGLESFGYRFEWNELLLPNIGFTDESQVLGASGELWYDPSHGVVVRYYLNLDVENVRILGSSLPVSGTALLRYDLFDLDSAPNISIPFGC